MTNVALRIGDSYRIGTFDHKPIEWVVVGVKDNLALIVTKDILEPMSFCTQKRGMFSSIKLNNYKESDIRHYLNNDFYKLVFNEFEKKAIIETKIDNSAEAFGKGKNKFACEDTLDKVFLLSAKEVIEGFTDRKQRVAKGTDFAIKKRLYVDHGHSIWWLRSPSPYNKNHVVCVEHDGDLQPYPINKHENMVNGDQIGIRPAMWVNPAIYNKLKEEADLIKSLTPKNMATYRNVNMPKEEKAEDISRITKAKLVSFGIYDGMPVNWRVLNIKDDKALLVSDRAIEYFIFDEYNAIFSTSGIRTWLNGRFYEQSFSDIDKKRIIKSTTLNSTEYDNDSLDNVFLLSTAEVKAFMPNPLDRICYPTLDCVHKGIATEKFKGSCSWYLRTPEVRSKILFINEKGEEDSDYPSDGSGIRPAIYVSLK